MDSADEALGRIVAFVNRRPWIMEDPDRESNYYLDTFGTSPQGDTSLHRLCAWHTNLDQLKNFLRDMQQDSSNPTLTASTVTQRNHQGVTCLHLAVYKNSYHAHDIIQHLLKLEPSLASTPMECGSYPLHILCGHNVTVRKDVLLALLQADPTVVCKQDRNGDTPLSLLWKNVQRFRWARQSTITLEDGNDSDTSTSQCSHESVAKMILSPDQCLDFSLEMIRAATRETTTTTTQWDTVSLTDICSMPRCPPPLVKLALQYFNRFNIDLHSADRCGRTALHQAALQEPMTKLFTLPRSIHTHSSVLDLLLDALPCQACIQDRSGRIPLHYALLSKDLAGQATDTIHRLVASNPDCFMMKDPITGLYPFALVAMNAVGTGFVNNYSGNYSGNGKGNGNDNEMDIDMDWKMIGGEEEVEQLNTSFWLLRQFPEAAIYDG